MRFMKWLISKDRFVKANANLMASAARRNVKINAMNVVLIIKPVKLCAQKILIALCSAK